MGKYMRKAKTAGEVALLTESSLGVRTRAKTLALQKKLSAAGGSSYLQLRSRRLEKPPIRYLKRQRQNPKPNPNSEGSQLEAEKVGGKEEEDLEKKGNSVDEAPFGENEGRERSTRESTPCSFIKDPECIRTPSSTTRPTSSIKASRRVENSMQRHIPTVNEMDEFFSGPEKQQQRQFIEKYNFDPVNDKPFPGRYEWVKLDP